MATPFPRFVWFDSDDLVLTESRMESLKRGQLSSWEWIRFDETYYFSLAEARDTFFQQLWSPSLFKDGKVIVVRGVPSFQQEIGESLDSIPENVLVILVAQVRKDIVLYKRLIKWDLGKIEVCSVMDRDECKEFIKKKATELGFEIDPQATTALLALVGIDRNTLSLELKKMAPLTVQGKLMSWAVEEACCGTGDVEVQRLCEAILKNDGTVAHVFLKRLLDRNENPLSISAFMFDWARKLAVADSCNGNTEEAKEKMTNAKKWNSTKNISEAMFPKLGAFYFVCRDYAAARPKRRWAYRAMRTVAQLQCDLKRGSDSVEILMHRAVENLLKGVK